MCNLSQMIAWQSQHVAVKAVMFRHVVAILWIDIPSFADVQILLVQLIKAKALQEIILSIKPLRLLPGSLDMLWYLPLSAHILSWCLYGTIDNRWGGSLILI